MSRGRWGVAAAMLAHDPRLLALLPAVGLCSCMVPTAATTATTAAPGDFGGEGRAPGLVEIDETDPLTVPEALIRSGRESLTAGHYAAAYQSLAMAMQRDLESAPDLYLDMIDAALGSGDVVSAERLIDDARRENLDLDLEEQLQSRAVLAREIKNGRGIGQCVAQVDAARRPLLRSQDPFAAWNALRSGLPSDHAIPIPTSEEAALEALCPSGCTNGEPRLARLEGDNEATIALVVAHGDGSFSVMPDVLHPVSTGCTEEPLFAAERHDGLVRVRAFADRLDRVNPNEWNLVEMPSYGAPASAASTYGSSGYASSGYASSGYASSGYASSGYHYGSGSYAYGSSYGCGYDYDYDYGVSCVVHAHVERDVILDLDRGEIVLDVVRTGERGAALGRVSMSRAPTGPVVDIQACGVRETLSLSYT